MAVEVAETKILQVLVYNRQGAAAARNLLGDFRVFVSDNPGQPVGLSGKLVESKGELGPFNVSCGGDCASVHGSTLGRVASTV